MRARLLERLVPMEAGVTGSGAGLPGGFVGQYVSMPLATTRLAPAATALALYTASRPADEIVTGGRSGFPWRRLRGRRE